MPQKIRSQIFQNAAKFEDKFKEYLEIAYELTPNQKKALLDGMPSLMKGLTRRDQSIARENITKAIGGSESKAVKAIDVLASLSNGWDPREDQVDSVLNDFSELELLPTEENKRKDASEFLRAFFNIVQSDNQRRLIENTSRSILPSLKNLSVGIDFRAVVESFYDWRGDEPGDYEPVIRTATPIAIFRIVLDEGDPIIFQCSYEEASMLIKKLQASLKEIDVAQALLK